MTVFTPRTRRAGALVAVAAAAGLGLFAAGTAQASSSAPLTAAPASVAAASAHSALRTAGVSPDAVCDSIISRGNLIALCSVGFYYDGGDPYRWPVTSLDTALSANRVWFHQNPDNSGWSKCYSGGGDYTITGEYQDPGNIQISANTAPC